MKLYSRKHFILGLICGLVIIFEGKHYDGAKSVIWIAFFAIQGFRCICAAFSKQALEREEAIRVRDRKVRRQLMGPFGAFAEYIALALCFGGVGLYALLWPSDWGGILLFICFVAATIFGIWFNARYRELMKQEEQENNEETKS